LNCKSIANPNLVQTPLSKLAGDMLINIYQLVGERKVSSAMYHLKFLWNTPITAVPNVLVCITAREFGREENN
jgi:hypothetical protein